MRRLVTGGCIEKMSSKCNVTVESLIVSKGTCTYIYMYTVHYDISIMLWLCHGANPI